MAERVVIEVVGQTEGLDELDAKLASATQREKELIAQMDMLSKQKQQWQGSAQVVAQFDKEISSVNSELKATKKSIEDLSKAQKAMPGAVIAENMNKSLRGQRMELMNAIANWSDWSAAGKKAYDETIAKAGELDDKIRDLTGQIRFMGSDTRTFDAILQGTQLVAGGFTVAQGAMSLFGSENKDLQQVMVKLQSVMAITMGLQQIQNTLQKESNLMTGISVWWKGVLAKAEELSAAAKTEDTAATIANTAAETANVVATGAQAAAATTATLANIGLAGAFKLVGFAIKSIPVFGWIIAGVAALVTVVQMLKNKTNEQIKKQTELNEIEKIQFEQSQQVADRYKEQASEKEKQMQNEIELMKARGASQAEIGKKETELLAQRRQNAAEQAGFYADEIKNLDENKKKVDELKFALAALNSGQMISVNVNGKIMDLKPTDESKKLLQSELDKWELKVKVGTETKEALDTANQAVNVNAEEQKQKAIQRAKNEAVAAAEIKVIEAKKGSQKELDARIAMIRTQQRVDLQNVELTASERKRIILKADKEIIDLRREFNKKQLQDEVTGLDAQLAQSKQLDLETYNLRLARLDAQKRDELAVADLTANQKKLIEANYLKDVKNLEEEYLDYQSKTETNTKASTINAQLALVKEGSKEEHDLKVELLKVNAQAERDNAILSIKNEDEKAAKLLEINSNLKKDIRQLDIDYIKTAEERSKDEIAIQEIKYNKGEISEREYNKRIRDIRIKSFDDEIADRKKNGEDTTKLELQKEIEITKNLKEQADERKKIIQELIQESIGTIGDIGDSLFTMQKNRLDAQTEEINHYYDTEIARAEGNATKQAQLEQQKAAKLLEIKRQQAQQSKNQATFDAIINVAQSVTRTAAQLGFPLAIPFIVMALAAGAIQIAAIRSQPLPKFWKGRKGGKGQFAMVGEQGAEIMWVPEGANIMPANDSRLALHGDKSKFDKWDMPRIDNGFVAPNINRQIINQYNRNHKNDDRLYIDYDLLAKKIGENVGKRVKIPKQRNVSVNFDKSGLSVTEGNTTTHYLNSKYKV